ncbi:hypothetical protein TUM3794_04570 [Shewanella colwelliana]|uniref:Uncharacterized protein n=1 Tax=Shewanella colwelliana TaxID=23 RepID=A0ABQ4NUX9_SHECO|nr:hypothetical protein [Shewanella colwelliana]GIU36036.1 hypothetical protein TUM3794_04570 [Shewanella colwelliana]
MKLRILFLVIFSLLGCEYRGESKISEELKWLLNADPKEDFEKSIASGDRRFVGVIGMFITVPYFDEECITDDKVRLIQISDMVDSYEQEKLQAIAPIYASTFNLYMLKHWNTHGIKPCDS